MSMNLSNPAIEADRAAASAQAPACAESVPVILLTGFLGSGKTTLVNAILSAAHGMKLAVLVNEFGSLGVDGRLITGAAGPVIELPNGCICCATGDDLLRALDAILAEQPDLDGVLIETSGLANPAPVVNALERGKLTRPVRISGIVTVVDALNFDDNLERAEAAFQQLVSADLLLINKCDLVDADVPAAIAAGVAKLNPHAPHIACVKGEVPLELIFDVTRVTPLAPLDCHERHEKAFQSMAVWTPRPLDTVKFDAWLDALPRSIYRGKGLLRFSEQEGMYAFHLVGARRTVESVAGVDRAFCSLTLIGKDIASFNLQSSFSQCAAEQP
jgi:G3E family GTPase